MSTNINDLREILFDTLKQLKDKDNPMDLDRAKTIGLISDRVIETAKVEVDAMRITRSTQSKFIPLELKEVTGSNGSARPALPGNTRQS